MFTAVIHGMLMYASYKADHHAPEITDTESLPEQISATEHVYQPGEASAPEIIEQQKTAG